MSDKIFIVLRINFTTKEEAKEIVLEIITTFTPIEIDTLKVLQAMDINSRYGYS